MEDLEVMHLDAWKSEFTEDECNFDKVEKYLEFIKVAVDRHDPDRYAEWHHVMPRCVDKDSKYSNHVVQINGADHLRVHMKLVECFNKDKKRKMGCALYRMRTVNFEDLSPEEYEEVRRLYSLSQTGELNHAYGKPSMTRNSFWVTNGTDNMRISSESDIPKGWQVGVTRDTRGKDIMITDGINSMWWSSKDEIPEGWRRGKTQVIPDHSGEKNPMYNKIWITDGTCNRFISKDDLIPLGWRRGATQNNPDQHGSNSAIYGKVGITNGKENRLVYPDEELPAGWRYGQTQDHSKYGCNFNQGKVYITNGVNNRMIKQDEVIPDGWRYGMTRKSV